MRSARNSVAVAVAALAVVASALAQGVDDPTHIPTSRSAGGASSTCGGASYACVTTEDMLLYVSPDGGSDANLCTASSPCATPGRAFSLIPPRVHHTVRVQLLQGATRVSTPQTLDGFTLDRNGSIIIQGALGQAGLDGGTSSGTLTAVTSAPTWPAYPNMVDGAQTWATNDLRGKLVRVTSGASAGKAVPILGNTGTTIYVPSTSGFAAAATYEIVVPTATLEAAGQNTMPLLRIGSVLGGPVYILDMGIYNDAVQGAPAETITGPLGTYTEGTLSALDVGGAGPNSAGVSTTGAFSTATNLVPSGPERLLVERSVLSIKAQAYVVKASAFGQLFIGSSYINAKPASQGGNASIAIGGLSTGGRMDRLNISSVMIEAQRQCVTGMGGVATFIGGTYCSVENVAANNAIGLFGTPTRPAKVVGLNGVWVECTAGLSNSISAIRIEDFLDFTSSRFSVVNCLNGLMLLRGSTGRVSLSGALQVGAGHAGIVVDGASSLRLASTANPAWMFDAGSEVVLDGYAVPFGAVWDGGIQVAGGDGGSIIATYGL